MTTTWSQTPGGTVSTCFHPGLVVRLIGGAMMAVGFYFLWKMAEWLFQVLRPGSGGVTIGEVIFLPIALVVASAFAVPGAMMAFFGATARVEPIPRRVFARSGFGGFGAEKATDIGDGAHVVVRLHVDERTSSSTSSRRNDYRVFSYKVLVEQPGAEPVEIGQFSLRQGTRARELAEAASKTLAVPVVDHAKAAENAVPEEDRITSEFLTRRGIDAPPRGFVVRAIGFVRLIVEALVR
jgi:hypothetical protein